MYEVLQQHGSHGSALGPGDDSAAQYMYCQRHPLPRPPPTSLHGAQAIIESMQLKHDAHAAEVARILQCSQLESLELHARAVQAHSERATAAASEAAAHTAACLQARLAGTFGTPIRD